MVKTRQKIGSVNPVQFAMIKTYTHSLSNQWIVVSWCCGVLAEPNLLDDERTQFDETLSRNIAEAESTLHELLTALKPLIELDEDLISQMNEWLTQLQTPLTVEDRSNIVYQFRRLIHQLRDLVSHRLTSE